MKQRKTRSKRNVSGDCKKGKSIFACKTTQKEVSSEATKTDCMNHGYRIIRTLGEGAYAKVKLAEVSASRLARNEEMSIKSEFTDGELQVAIKVISKTAIPKEFLLKFLPREVENHSRLPDHPHVVRVFDHFSTHGHVYLVMEYCKNGDLLDLINNHIGTNQKGIGEELSRKLFRQICEGLLHIHSNNIVHRDLKCENVLLDENMDAKLTDFGFSATVEDPKAMLRTSCGSYAYTAPEVIRNKPYEGFKADIWSLGIMLFAMINGRLPFNDAQILDMEEDMKMQRLRFERSATFDCMVLIRKLLQYHPLERPCLDDIINDPWLCGKKPIPRQVQRAKINPYPGRKPGEKEVSTIVHTPTEVIELPASMRNNTICYRQDLSPRAYNDSLTGTVTVKQKDGETVTLKSRTGRSFGKKIEVPAVCNRPATWPRSKTGSPELKKPTNKPRTQTQYQHTGADIRNVARLIVDKYKQGETIPSNSKEVPKQVPLWLLNQVLNSEGVQTDHEKIALLGKQVPAHSPYCSPSETPNQESRPSTGCPACTIKSMSTPSGSEKENQHNPANNQKKSKTTLRKSANGSYMSSTPSVGDIPPSPTPYDCQSPTLRKQRIGYTSPIPIKKTEERNSMRASDPQYCYEKELVPQVSGLRLGPERSTSTRATKVSSGFKFKVMTPASRAHMCRERKMQAYTNQAFHQAIWPLPLVHGTNLPMNRSPPKPRPTPRDKNPNANPRDSKPTAKSEDDGRCMTIGGTVKPRHTLVVHVAS